MSNISKLLYLILSYQIDTFYQGWQSAKLTFRKIYKKKHVMWYNQPGPNLPRFLICPLKTSIFFFTLLYIKLNGGIYLSGLIATENKINIKKQHAYQYHD